VEVESEHVQAAVLTFDPSVVVHCGEHTSAVVVQQYFSFPHRTELVPQLQIAPVFKPLSALLHVARETGSATHRLPALARVSQ
jgi:hypothetical protein